MTKPYFRDVFSSYVTKGFESWDYLTHIGRENIDKLIERLQNGVFNLESSNIKDKKELYFFVEKTGKDLKNMRSTIDFIPEMGIRKDSWSGDEEPLNPIASSIQNGATNFSMCGWCKHCRCGSGRYSYYINGTCRFTEKSVNFINKCSIKEDDSLIFTPYIEKLQNEINKNKDLIEKYTQAIYELYNIRETAESKPLLTSLRPDDFFKVATEIVFFTKPYKDEWMKGNIINGYRTHDGITNFISQKPFHDNLDFHNGHGGNIQQNSWDLLYEKDLQFLIEAQEKDPIFFDIWVRNAEGDSKGSFKENIKFYNKK